MQLRDKVLLVDKTFPDSQDSPNEKAPDFYTVKEVMELFYLDRMGGERSVKTLDFYREHFNGFLKRFPHLADASFTNVKVEHLRDYLLSKSDHIYAKAGAYRSFRALYYFAMRESIVAKNLVKQITSPKLPKRKMPRVRSHDLDLLLKTCGPTFLGYRDRAIMLLMYDTGMRLSEVTNMTFSNLELRNRRIQVLGKGNKERTVKFDERVRRALIQYIYDTKTRFKTDMVWLTEEEVPIKAKGIQEMIARRSIMAGLPRIHPHMFRHACAYNLLKNGMNIHAVMRYLGQESIAVLQNYLTDADSEYASELHDEFSPLRNRGK